jgi:dynein heavy chain
LLIFRPAAEQEDLHNLFNKYVIKLIELILEGIMNEIQGQKLKTIVPLTHLNMVNHTGKNKCI